jgi:hypothetical protein
MSIYDIYETNLELEKEGTWVEITKEIKVKVAAIGNKNHLEAIEKFSKPYKGQLRTKSIDPDIEEDIYVKALAKAILVDWQGITDEEGNIIAYNFDNAYALLSKPSMKRFKADILFMARETETFKKDTKEQAEKN